MRVIEIRVQQRTNTGQYEHLEFGATAVVDEGESTAEVTNRLTSYVDWHARKPLRDETLRQMKNVLADEKAPEDAKTRAQKWIDTYNARKAEVESI